MGREFELKYGAAPAQQQAVLGEFSGFSEIAMETTYYDTPSGAFSARKMTLRRRLENGRSVCTLKAPGGSHARQEWETACGSVEAAVSELCKLSGFTELPSLAAEGLFPVCGARFTRMAATVALADCTVEIAVDSGVLLAGSRQAPLGEVEVELKDGSEAAAIAFAEALAARHGLKAEPKSKFRRALELAQEG